MKVLFLIISLLFGSLSFAGGGVVVGDGNPINLTNQVALNDLGEVENELKSVIEKLSLYSPDLAYVYNFGLEQIKNKKINLMYLPEYSDDHYAYIKDTDLEFNDRGMIKLIKRPTIYFFKNYFDLKGKISVDDDVEQVTKLDVVIHELSHLFFGTDELKIQRITKLLVGLKNGKFDIFTLDALKAETKFFTDQLKIFENGIYNPSYNIGLNYSCLSDFPSNDCFPMPPKVEIKNLSWQLLPLVQKNLILILSHYKRYIYNSRDSLYFEFRRLDHSQFNFIDGDLSEKEILQYLVNEDYFDIDPHDLEFSEDLIKTIMMYGQIDYNDQCLKYQIDLYKDNKLTKKKYNAVGSYTSVCTPNVKVNYLGMDNERAFISISRNLLRFNGSAYFSSNVYFKEFVFNWFKKYKQFYKDFSSNLFNDFPQQPNKMIETSLNLKVKPNFNKVVSNIVFHFNENELPSDALWSIKNETRFNVFNGRINVENNKLIFANADSYAPDLYFNYIFPIKIEVQE